MSGQVRSECLTYTFRGKKEGGGGGGNRLHWRVQGSTNSATGIGNRRRVFGGVIEFATSYHCGARCSSVVRAFAHGAIGRRIDSSWGGPIELFLVPGSGMLSCLWDDAYKITLAANRK